MPLLDIQRRMAEVGRVRIGARTERGAPKKLATFRVTSQSRDIIASVAAVYGGTPTEWQPGPKEPMQWEVFTDATALHIIVTPGQVFSQWWELWSGGGCQRRCDGISMQDGASCVCPADYEERRTLAAKGGACKPTTRFSFMLREVQALGLFRIETHGIYAAMEMGGVAELLEHATKLGTFLPATLRLDQRTAKRDGQTMRYAVPVIDVHSNVSKVLESIGVLDAPALDPPTPMAALPSGSAVRQPGSSRAALPEAPKGRTRPVNYPAPPDLPSDPSFTIDPPIVAGSTAPLPGDTDQATKRSQQLHISARNSNCLDMLGELVEWATDGRTTSSKEVTDEEASKLQDAFYRIKKGRATVSYDGEGRLVLS